ncbi:MAG: M16 family metallopeptidase [bacterium]
MKTVFRLVILSLAILVHSDIKAIPAGEDVTGNYFFDNGLEVRLIHRQATPLVSTLVLVKSGYAMESMEQKGYSHLLEHLIFSGTDRRSKGQIMKEVEGVGGYINGFTRADYTGYIVVGHRDYNDDLMDLLSDILFNSLIEDTALDEARRVVVEEILREKSRPGARIDEVFQRLLYPQSPYSHTVLGSESSLASATRQRIKDFYLRTYRPDNMILLISGGFDEGATLRTLERTFGSLRPGGKTGNVPAAPRLAGRRIYNLRAGVPDVQVRVGFAGPDPRDDDAEALELLGSILGGRGGLLVKALESAGMKPRSVSASLNINRNFSRFVITAGFPGETDPHNALEVILTAIPVATRGSITLERVIETREKLVFEETVGREKIQYFLMEKAPWAVSGAPGQGFSAGRWDNLGPDELNRAFRSFLVDKPYVALLVVPETGLDVIEGTTREPLLRKTLDNGITIVAEERPGSQVFSMHLMTRRRSSMEPEGKDGIADFMHRLLSRGTDERSREEIEDELRKLGVSLSTAGNPTSPFGDFYTSRTYSYIRMESLLDKAENAASLMAEMVLSPSFPETEIEDVRKEMLDFISYRDSRPSSVSSTILARHLYSGVLAGDILGTPDSIRSITRKDLQEFHQEYFTGNNIILSVVSGLPAAESMELAESLFSALPEGQPPAAIVLPITKEQHVARSKLGKPQGAVAIGSITGEIEGEYLPALSVASGILNQRIAFVLREKEGLAYSVRASLSNLDGHSLFLLSMGSAPDKIERARKSIRREIESIRRSDVTQEEINIRVNAIFGRLQMRMLSSINRAYYLGLSARNGLDHAFGEDYRGLLMSVTPDDVKNVWTRFLPRKNLVEAIVR